jgi:hypothetical protein
MLHAEAGCNAIGYLSFGFVLCSWKKFVILFLFWTICGAIWKKKGQNSSSLI